MYILFSTCMFISIYIVQCHSLASFVYVWVLEATSNISFSNSFRCNTWHVFSFKLLLQGWGFARTMRLGLRFSFPSGNCCATFERRVFVCSHWGNINLDPMSYFTFCTDTVGPHIKIYLVLFRVPGYLLIC